MPGSVDTDYRDNVVLASLWGSGLLLTDILFYGWLIPVGGVYFAGGIAVSWDLDPFLEVVIVVVSVFAILFVTFYAHLETKFWTHLFSRDQGFLYILQIRDTLNLFMMIYCFRCVFHSIRDMVSDHEMKKEYLSEGLGYIVLKPLVDWGLVSETWLDSCQCQINLVIFQAADQHGHDWMYDFLLQWAVYLGFVENKQTPVHVDCVKDKFVHGAQFVFAIAGLTAAITKVVYFNTLFAYLRAMNIFISMQSDERDSDEEDMDEDDHHDNEGIMNIAADKKEANYRERVVKDTMQKL